MLVAGRYPYFDAVHRRRRARTTLQADLDPAEGRHRAPVRCGGVLQQLLQPHFRRRGKDPPPGPQGRAGRLTGCSNEFRGEATHPMDSVHPRRSPTVDACDAEGGGWVERDRSREEQHSPPTLVGAVATPVRDNRVEVGSSSAWREDGTHRLPASSTADGGGGVRRQVNPNDGAVGRTGPRGGGRAHRGDERQTALGRATRWRLSVTTKRATCPPRRSTTPAHGYRSPSTKRLVAGCRRAIRTPDLERDDGVVALGSRRRVSLRCRRRSRSREPA